MWVSAAKGLKPRSLRGHRQHEETLSQNRVVVPYHGESSDVHGVCVCVCNIYTCVFFLSEHEFYKR